MNGAVLAMVVMVTMDTAFLGLLWFLPKTFRPADIAQYRGFTFMESDL
jgi:hypothetical protein